MIPEIEQYPHLARLVQHQLAAFPEHESYLERRFTAESGARYVFDDFVADMILRIVNDQIETVCGDYRWLCSEMLKEELHFRRTGRYRLSSFADAVKEVYSNRIFMTRYLNGILASQLWWDNHNAALWYFRDRFLPGNTPGFAHLEVGPGHGLYLHLAASSPHCARAEGWDVSDTSLGATRAALDRMGSSSRIALRKVDFSGTAPTGRFQSITFSEVLEHLEDPVRALKGLFDLLDGGGRIFINAPVNSPAPDHIYLFNTPEDVAKMIERVGFKVQDHMFAPCTGASLERARKLKLSISAVVIATK